MERTRAALGEGPGPVRRARVAARCFAARTRATGVAVFEGGGDYIARTNVIIKASGQRGEEDSDDADIDSGVRVGRCEGEGDRSVCGMCVGVCGVLGKRLLDGCTGIIRWLLFLLDDIFISFHRRAGGWRCMTDRSWMRGDLP